jgi:hypothetical protein
LLIRQEFRNLYFIEQGEENDTQPYQGKEDTTASLQLWDWKFENRNLQLFPIHLQLYVKILWCRDWVIGYASKNYVGMLP